MFVYVLKNTYCQAKLAFFAIATKFFKDFLSVKAIF